MALRPEVLAARHAGTGAYSWRRARPPAGRAGPLGWPMMSVRDALKAWQAGKITRLEAMRLTGAEDAADLFAFAHWCAVGIRREAEPGDREARERAATIVARVLAGEDDGGPA